jgi:putative zinc finger protein
MAGDMRPRPVSQSRRCDRAREWSSLRLDGELSELEDALLQKHLEGCGDCRGFERELRSTADLLRTAPAEAPVARFEIPAARTRSLLSRRLALAAVAAAALLGSLVGSYVNRPAPRPVEPAPQVSLLTRDLSQLRELPRHQPVRPVAPGREPGSPPEGII